ncbi:MAG: hypothetical protein ACRDP6_23925 [Actinoallomurus sp.]
MRSSVPSGSPTQYKDPKAIDALLKSSDPAAVADAGRSYQKFASAYEKIAAEVLSMRTDLHGAWDGKDAAAAQSQLREVWSAATTVHKTASTFGIAVERHGSESLAWYKNNKPPSQDLAEAQSWMAGANERVAQSWGSLPQDISTSLPPGGTSVDEHTPVKNGSGAGGGHSSDVSSTGSGANDHGRGTPGLLDRSHGGPGPLPGNGGAGAQLASFSPSGGGGTAVGSGNGIEPTPGSSGGFTPGGGTGSFTPGGGPVPGSGLIGDPLPGGVGSGEVRSGAPGGRAPGESGGAAGEQAQSAREGVTGPMGGGGTDRQEHERTRQTWLAEDEDVWTGGIQPAPGIIGIETGDGTEPDLSQAPPEDEDFDLAEILDDLGTTQSTDSATEIAELRAKLERLERQARNDNGDLADDVDAIGNPDWTTGR